MTNKEKEQIMNLIAHHQMMADRVVLDMQVDAYREHLWQQLRKQDRLLDCDIAHEQMLKDCWGEAILRM